jgi:hypothetical protein
MLNYLVLMFINLFPTNDYPEGFDDIIYAFLGGLFVFNINM